MRGRGKGQERPNYRTWGGPSSSPFISSKDEDARDDLLLRRQGSYRSVEYMLDLDVDCNKDIYMDGSAPFPARGGNSVDDFLKRRAEVASSG